MKFNGLILLCLFVLADDFRVESHRLKSPADTTPQEFPYHAGVDAKQWFCGGILVTKNFVLTPAHCLNQTSSVTTYVGFRRHPNYALDHLERNTQTFKSRIIYIHEDYAQNGDGHYLNDIALIKLPKPVTLSRGVRPGKFIAKEEAYLLEEGFANVTGWFADHDLNMQVETVRLINQDTCRYVFGTRFLKNQEICAKSVSIAHVDLIGSTLNINGKIAGLLAKKYACSDVNKKSTCKKTQVFTNLHPFLGWISEKVGIPIRELTDKTQTSSSDLTSIKIEALTVMFKHTKAMFEENSANLNKKIENIVSELTRTQQDRITDSLYIDKEIQELKAKIDTLKNQDEIQQQIKDISSILAESRDFEKLENKFKDFMMDVNTRENFEFMKIEQELEKIHILTEEIEAMNNTISEIRDLVNLQ